MIREKSGGGVFPTLLFLGLILISLFLFFSPPGNRTRGEYLLLNGKVFGIGYAMKFLIPVGKGAETVVKGIQQRLERLENLTSLAKESSALSQFNQQRDLKGVMVDHWLMEMVVEALNIHSASGGYFDITIFPLLELWGLSRLGQGGATPTPEEVERVRGFIGAEKLELDLQSLVLKKREPRLRLDLSALASGFAVDKIAEFLNSEGVENFFIDIGGESRVKGFSDGGKPWKFEIRNPRAGADSSSPMVESFEIFEGATSTSGNFRNLFMRDGRYFSRTINPFTGMPVTGPAAIVTTTVIGPSCARADGLATALMAMPLEKGREMMAHFAGYEYLILRPNSEGLLVTEKSPGLNGLLKTKRVRNPSQLEF